MKNQMSRFHRGFEIRIERMEGNKFEGLIIGPTDSVFSVIVAYEPEQLLDRGVAIVNQYWRERELDCEMRDGT